MGQRVSRRAFLSLAGRAAALLGAASVTGPLLGPTNVRALGVASRHATRPRAPRVADQLGLGEDTAQVLMGWRGAGDDTTLYYSVFDALASLSGDPAWRAQGIVDSGGGSSLGPAATTTGDGAPVLAWKGIETDPTVYWTRRDAGWSGLAPAGVGTIATTSRPAVASDGSSLGLLMVWRQEDATLAFATYDGSSWSAQQPINGGAFTSSDGPAIAPWNGNLLMAWKGTGDDARIFWSVYDGKTWLGQQVAGGGSFGTGAAPALAMAGGTMHMAWRGAGEDSRIYHSSLSGPEWSAQELVEAVGGTSDAPALAGTTAGLLMAWKGIDDQSLWWSVFDGTAWSTQQHLADAGSTAGPALTGLPFGLA